MNRPQMPIGSMTFEQWQSKNFLSLLWWCLVTRQNFDDWNEYCALQFDHERQLEADQGIAAAMAYADHFYEQKKQLEADILPFRVGRRFANGER